MTERVLAVAAHPDDIEFLMAGTLLRLRQAGYELHYMNVADGCCGSTRTDRAATARIRRQEAQTAAARLGAVYHESLCHDLEVFYDLDTLQRLTSVVRQVAPRILLTHAPSDYMEDHANTARLAVTAAFARGMPNFHVHPLAAPVLQPITVYHAQPYGNHDPLRNLVTPDLFVDITDVQTIKVEALAEHASQKLWLDESQGLDSYLQTVRDLDAEVGRMSGRFALAEGWRRRLHLGLCAPHDDPLSQALAGYVCHRPM